jgi:hypothetical protein
MLRYTYNAVALYRAVSHITVTKQTEHSALCTCMWYIYCPAALVEYFMQDKVCHPVLVYQRMDMRTHTAQLLLYSPSVQRVLISYVNCALLGYHPLSNGKPLPMFQDSVSVPSSRVKKSKSCCFWTFYPWRWERYFVPKRRQRIIFRRCIIPQKSAVHVNMAAEACNHAYLLLWGNEIIHSAVLQSVFCTVLHVKRKKQFALQN